MKIIEAYWEKKNLGVDTLEITFDQNDSMAEVAQLLSHVKAEYIVLKVPTELTKLLPLIQNNGYQYIEDMIHLVNHLPEIQMSLLETRLYDSITTEKMTDSDMEQLYAEIRNGLFNKDRIYLDPYFSHEMAKTRYINWIKDEKARGTEFLKHTYKNNTIGFFALRELQNGHYISFIGAIYEEYRKLTMGTVAKVQDEVKRRNGKKLSTNVSSNNISEIKALTSKGYIAENITHTFIQHF